MNLSYKWLKELVDIDVNIKEFCDAMTMSGSKVEGYEVEGGAIDKIVTGKVEAIEKHPDADKLLVCSLNVGKSENLQIVTGAKNLKVGDIVPVALDGSTLFDGTKIKKGKLRKVLSCGMLCSLGELGLSIDDFPNAAEDGIFVLDKDCVLGQNIKDAIGFNDTKIEFEITPNRSDCLSVIGLAREAAATFNKTLNLHEPIVKAGGGTEEKIDVSVEEPELCPYYSARVVKNVKIGPSPLWMRAKLRVMGVNPINNIVDITNYVMLECGQPLHAFDLRFIEDKKIIVRKAKSSEKITTLDGIERTLYPENLVIADSKKPIAIAGVKGGEFSGIMDDTKDIVFESANFFGPSVRKTAKMQNMRTDASALYEKGLDINNCPKALDRACELVEMLGIGEVSSNTVVSSELQKNKFKIKFEPKFINDFLNTQIDDDTMINILNKLDMVYENGFILVPTFRQDIKNKNDLAEEVARFYGYNNIPSTNITGGSFGGLSLRQKFEEKIRSMMVAQGVSEILTYSFISPKNFDKLLLPTNHNLRNAVKIQNPLGEDTSVMRTTMVASMMEVLARNYNNKNKSVQFYEIAREYLPQPGLQLPQEKNKLVAGFYGENVDFFKVKGIVEELLVFIKLLNYDVTANSSIEYCHPGRCASLEKDGDTFGCIGEIHPLVCDNYGIKQNVYIFELDIDKIFEYANVIMEYKPIAKFPSSERDLALVCDEDIPVATLQKIISENTKNLLEKTSIFDVYQGEQIAKGKKSVAFNLVFRSDKETLNDEKVNALMKKIIKAFKTINVELR